MGLLETLGLRKKAASNEATGPQAAPPAAPPEAQAAEAAHAELQRQLNDAVKLVAGIADAKTKVALATELAHIDEQRKATQKLPDLAQRAQAHAAAVPEVKKVMVRAGQAVQDGNDERRRAQAAKMIAALAKTYDKHVLAAQADVDAQVVPALKTALSTELQALRAARAEVDKLDPVAGEAKMKQVDSDAHTFAMRAAKLRKEAVEGQRTLQDWGTKPVADVQKLVDGLGSELKPLFTGQMAKLQARLVAAKALLDKGDLDQLTTVAGNLGYACRDLTTAVNQAAVEYPKYQTLRANVVTMIQRMREGGLLDADGEKGVAGLEAAMQGADAVGPIRGYAAARNSLNAVVVVAKGLRDNNGAYRDYQAEHDKVVKAVEALRKHPQADKLKAELARIDQKLKAADALAKGAEGGALKGLTALKSITSEVAEGKLLAGKLAAAEKKLPALSKKLADSGVDKAKVADVARYAIKVLVEENCSDDDAVKMAKDASGYKDAGLDEQDAIMSSRVKKSLEDSGMPADQAQSIGQNIRAGGTASAEDAKALAQAMKGVSKKAIDALNAAGISTECCRGAITDAMPELAGVKPRGWPETASWDDVPGVFNPSEKKLVVGTMEKDGKRAVPASGEGPLPHGATDLFGHEGGHALDAANPGGKSANAAFLAARQVDIAAGKMKGSAAGGQDDYFLSAAEGGANTDGATSETFAESFAMYTAGPSRWPELQKFWQTNPWGV